MHYGNYKIQIKDGLLKELLDITDNSRTNFLDHAGRSGSIAYTYLEDDVTVLHDKTLPPPFCSRLTIYHNIEQTENGMICTDIDHAITTIYAADESGLTIESRCDDDRISQFALNLDLNFMGKKGGSYTHQLLPTTPYTSDDGQYMYYLMLRPDKKVLAVAGLCEGLTWKLQYSPDGLFHYIDGLQIISDFDKIYAQTNRKHIAVKLFVADSVEDAIARIGTLCDAPYCTNVISGGFGNACVQVSKDTTHLLLEQPNLPAVTLPVGEDRTITLSLTQYGLATVTPLCNTKKGLPATLFNGVNRDALFFNSCASIHPPYHNDLNLCEGGMFLWAMLVYMRLYQDDRFCPLVKEELRVIMGQDGQRVPRRSILPYQTEYAPYHICASSRVQEQFTGISILIEAYKLFQEEDYLLHALHALQELEENWITEDGMIFSLDQDGSMRDYTTVCAPVITIADMARLLETKNPSLAQHYQELAIKIADYLVERGFQFPTEGTIAKNKEPEVEDGSISCSALSVLYVCKYIKHKDSYLTFAKRILDLHDTWTIYTPDARMYQSSFRWWETIWEGDGEGPAICAGHAWTIWRAEALFWYGILAHDDRAMMQSWNGYITNFAKIEQDGSSYSCYEADYIRGGGIPEIKEKMLQLKGEDHAIKYRLAHGYPSHKDNSLSRYVWCRYEDTWYQTACILEVDGKLFGIHATLANGVWILEKGIRQLYLGDISSVSVFTVKSETPPKLISRFNYIISDNDGNYSIRKDEPV